MPTLDRLWTFWPWGVRQSNQSYNPNKPASQSNQPDYQVWLTPQPDSPLAGVARDVSNFVPESTISVRMRYRGDVRVRSQFTDPAGQEWYVNEWTEVGRRRFIDVSITNYSPPVGS